ncbi:MAG: replication-relaxation family protein [Myxococcales bacterium]|nr:replication-relaxation family protein [Myxococcales bacterium]
MTMSEYAQAAASDRGLACLEALFRAHPIRLTTRVLARWVLQTAGQSASSADKRMGELLGVLAARRLVTMVTEPNRPGRPPAFWGLTTAGISFLAECGRVTSSQIAAKPRSNKSAATLRNRVHDFHVMELAACIHEQARIDPSPKAQLVEVITDKSCWREVVDLEGECHSVAPDLVAVYSVGGKCAVLFVEVQGTAPALSAVTSKLAAFQQYFAGGGLARDYQQAVQARVAFVTFTATHPLGSADHKNNILETTALSVAMHPLVRVASLTDLWESGFSAPRFLAPGDYVRCFVDLPEHEQRRFTDARHAVNRVRLDRDRWVASTLPLRRWFE